MDGPFLIILVQGHHFRSFSVASVPYNWSLIDVSLPELMSVDLN